jgi:ferredoxin-type protein NapH
MEKRESYLKAIKIVLWVYVILCFVIAGLNYGYAANAPKSVAEAVNWIWIIYENWVKTAFIILCSILILKMATDPQRTAMRRKNLIGFIFAALAVHIALPLAANNYDLYFYALPLPWSTVPLQLFDAHSAFYQSSLAAWGSYGIAAGIVFFIAVSIIVPVASLLFGRRFQCSNFCLFNGFASEVFEPAMPLVGKNKRFKPGTVRILSVVRWIFLGIALFFTGYWVLLLAGVSLPLPDVFAKAETYKYLVLELLAMIFFWIAFMGRGYCYYCPVGTVLSLFAKIGNQRITTGHTNCIACNQCNKSCPMAIDIKSKAVQGQPVWSIRCVGCGHCVDDCPTENLAYTTRFIDVLNKRAASKKRLAKAPKS